jgi:hypothetical protein
VANNKINEEFLFNAYHSVVKTVPPEKKKKMNITLLFLFAYSHDTKGKEDKPSGEYQLKLYPTKEINEEIFRNGMTDWLRLVHSFSKQESLSAEREKTDLFWMTQPGCNLLKKRLREAFFEEIQPSHNREHKQQNHRNHEH